MSAPASNGAYDEWLDALAEGEGYALVCPDGHGSLPATGVPGMRVRDALRGSPRRDRNRRDVQRRPRRRPAVRRRHPVRERHRRLRTGPAHGGSAGIDPATDAVEIGDRVAPGVEERVTDGEPLVVFRPADGE